MIRTIIVDYDDQIRQEHEEVEVNNDRCDDILTVCYNYLGEIIEKCSLSPAKRHYIREAYEYIDEAFRTSWKENGGDPDGN